MGDKGLVEIWMERLFGSSWRTSALGILAVLPQVVNLAQTYALDMGMSKGVMDTLTLIFGVLTVLNIKDSKGGANGISS
jgi:hypothetical protein